MTATVNDDGSPWDASQRRCAAGMEAGFDDRNQGGKCRKAASHGDAHRLRQFALSP
jgi:hypothetical protein